MTDRTNDLPPGKAIMPEVIDASSDSILTPEENVLINDTISFINRTVSDKALEAALLIGDYILTNYFDDDIESAISKDPDKPVSFNVLCEHPELNISRYKLANMVKVAAQERFFKSMDFNFSSLHYSHRLKLTQLPNDESKVEIARECINENLTTPQLAYRVKIKKMAVEPAENGLPEADAAEKAFNMLVTSMDRLTRQTAILNFESVGQYIDQMSPETNVWLQNKIMTLIDSMDAAESECNGFLQQLQNRSSDDRY